MPTTRVPALTYEEAPAGSRPAFDQQIRHHGRMTNMKRTLAHSPVALRAFMEWYPLRDEVAEFLGAPATAWRVTTEPLSSSLPKTQMTSKR